jgi:predicted ATP-grasp superfamily ATP-dependent carboligase
MPAAPFKWIDEPDAPTLSPGAVLLTSFPSAGLAAIVAAQYIVRSLNLPRIGYLDSPDAAPIALVQSGHVQPAVRVYGRPNLALVVSEFPTSASASNSIAEAVLGAAEAKHCRMVLCLEGVVPHPVEEEPETDAAESIWVVQSTADAAQATSFRAAGARALEDGVIGGVSGAMLVRGLHRRIPVAVLLTSSQGPEGFPDHRAGAALIEMLDRYVPELGIDTGPLRTQAELIERALRAAMKNRPRTEESAPSAESSPTPGMYQ